MKKVILFISIICLFGCTDPNEPALQEYKLIVTNETNQSFVLIIKSGNNEIYNQNILPNASSQICTYTFNNSSGFYGCGTATMELKFPNNKGYKCSNIENGNNTSCFNNNRNLLGEVGYIDIGNNQLEFKVTEDDYVNAFDL